LATGEGDIGQIVRIQESAGANGRSSVQK